MTRINKDLIVRDHVIDYQVLTEWDQQILSREVHRHLAMGYLLYGSPSKHRQVMIKLAPPGTPIMPHTPRKK